MNKIESFDAIRGIACLIVMVAHWVATIPVIGIYASGCGKIGVWCFMLLSGFFLLYPYIDDNKKFLVKSYYYKKIVRIYPSYIIALMVAVAIGFITFENLGLHLVAVEGVGHFWYMPVIIKLYLVFPIVILIKKICKSNLSLAIVLVIITILFLIVFPFTKYVENSIALYWYLPIFVIGMLMALIYKSLIRYEIKNILFDVIAVAALIVIFLLTPFMRKLILGIEPSGWLQNKYLLIGTLWAVFLLGVLFSRYLNDFLSKSKFLKCIGKYSFELYLLHYLVLWKLGAYIQNIWIRGALMIVISGVGAVCINKLVSKIRHCIAF